MAKMRLWPNDARKPAKNAVSKCNDKFIIAKHLDVKIEILKLNNFFSAGETTEAPSNTNKPTTVSVCEDTSSRCNKYKKYCGKNGFVTKRCQKTCEACGKFIWY